MEQMYAECTLVIFATSCRLWANSERSWPQFCHVCSGRSRDQPKKIDRFSLTEAAAIDKSRSVNKFSFAPARLNTNCYFLPRTRFQRSDGGHVTASQLLRDGGDIVLGPGGKGVRVGKAVKHLAEEKDLVQFRLEGASHQFTVTVNHLVKLEGPSGQPVVDVVASPQPERKRVFDGLVFRTVEVVEGTFAENATVLAWTPPKRAIDGTNVCRMHASNSCYLLLPLGQFGEILALVLSRVLWTLMRPTEKD